MQITLRSADWSPVVMPAAALRGGAGRVIEPLPPEFLEEGVEIADRQQFESAPARRGAVAAPLEFETQSDAEEVPVVAVRSASGALSFHAYLDKEMPAAAVVRGRQRVPAVGTVKYRFQIPVNGVTPPAAAGAVRGGFRQWLDVLLLKVKKATIDKVVASGRSCCCMARFRMPRRPSAPSRSRSSSTTYGQFMAIGSSRSITSPCAGRLKRMPACSWRACRTVRASSTWSPTHAAAWCCGI
jgi:hypothetical protein